MMLTKPPVCPRVAFTVESGLRGMAYTCIDQALEPPQYLVLCWFGRYVRWGGNDCLILIRALLMQGGLNPT